MEDSKVAFVVNSKNLPNVQWVGMSNHTYRTCMSLSFLRDHCRLWEVEVREDQKEMVSSGNDKTIALLIVHKRLV